MMLNKNKQNKQNSKPKETVIKQGDAEIKRNFEKEEVK